MLGCGKPTGMRAANLALTNGTACTLSKGASGGGGSKGRRRGNGAGAAGSSAAVDAQSRVEQASAVGESGGVGLGR